MPKIDVDAAPISVGGDYPGGLDAEVAGRVRRRLGDAVGLTGMGVNLTTLPAGGRSSLRHWHEVEDEMVFVLSGVLTLIEGDEEIEIGPGEAAGFRGGDPTPHAFENRTDQDVVMLEIGTRPREDRCHYADHDLIAHDRDGETWFTRRDGTALTPVKRRFE